MCSSQRFLAMKLKLLENPVFDRHFCTLRYRKVWEVYSWSRRSQHCFFIPAVATRAVRRCCVSEPMQTFLVDMGHSRKNNAPPVPFGAAPESERGKRAPRLDGVCCKDLHPLFPNLGRARGSSQ
ncbi:unnamed protein product [Scytosiphon promiscuus]